MAPDKALVRMMLRACLASLLVHTVAAVDLPLLEASGAAKGVLLVAGNFTSASNGALLQNDVGLPIYSLAGPTPHVVHSHVSVFGSGGVPIAGTAALGIVPLAPSTTPALCIIIDETNSHSLACAVLSSGPPATKTQTLVAQGAVSVAALGANSLLVLSTPGPSCPDVKPFKMVSADPSSGALSVKSETDLGVASKAGFEWRAVGAGEVSGSGVFAAVRSSANHTLLDVYLFSTATTKLRASATLAATVACKVISLQIVDVYADGAPALYLFYSDSTADVLWLTDGADALYRAATSRLDPAGPTTQWLGASAGSWLTHSPHVLPGEAQIVGLRAPPQQTSAAQGQHQDQQHRHHPAFHANLLLFGRPEHWLRRRASISDVRAMQEFKSSFKDNGANVANVTAPLDTDRMKQILSSVHANTYSYSVCDCDWSEDNWSCSTLYHYEEFVHFLEATKSFKVDGQQLRVWMGLYPPSEAKPTGCKPPPDSPLTPFNETELWDGAAYANYTLWGDLAGRLGQLYPHLVAVDIDDFSSNVVTGAFDGNYVAKITSNMRARSPWLALSSVLYSNFSSFPDLALMLDAPVFFFRNAMEGAQTCAPSSCPWGPHARSHSGSCLAGVCSEPTTFNAPLEVAQVVAGMPPSRTIITGYYATGHSSSGQPTARYVSRLLQTLAVQDRVGGVMTYCAKAALAPCEAPPLFGNNTNATLQHSLGCIVQRAYGAMSHGGGSI